MGSTPEESIENDSFLKINTFWSEAEENIESFAVKEEIISDLEQEINDDASKNSFNEGEKRSEREDESHDKISNASMVSTFQFFNKEIKKKNTKLESEQIESQNGSSKSNCVHDTKSFKIVNRRLRCGDCRSLVCPECFKIMFSTLHNHFLGFDTSNCNVYSCKFCCFPFQSLCALQAHIRIHTMEMPYVCPDCGLIYSNAYFLILHLINKCFHVYKIVSYKCPRCPNVYFSSDTYFKHIQDFHLVSILKCSDCSSSFESTVDFEKHLESSHAENEVQHLNDFFKCNLCSDMIIPSFMYEKHINYHCKNIESYEVEYMCLCGEVFSLIGAFRAHIQFCNKKGILPPRWGFLKKNLKNQDIKMVENSKSGPGDGDPETPDKRIDKNDKIGENIRNIDECENDDSNSRNGVDFPVQNDIQDKGENAQLSPAREQQAATIQETPAKGKGPERDFFSGEREGESHLKIKISEGGEVSQEVACSSSSERKDSQDVENCALRDKRIAEAMGDPSKLFYDYIPCDHMGYVKTTQGPNASPKQFPEEEKNNDCIGTMTPNNYHVVMELDERTGLMVSKKFSPENCVENSTDKTDSRGGGSSQGNETRNANPQEEISCRLSGPVEKTKAKSVMSFFVCPFCSVLFPKNSSTFQQFKLHIEYYHPDAALNIAVHNEASSEDAAAAINCKSDEGRRRESSKIDISRPNNEKAKRFCAEKTLSASDLGGTNDGSRNLTGDDEKENEINRENFLEREDAYWTVNLSFENSKANGDSGERTVKNDYGLTSVEKEMMLKSPRCDYKTYTKGNWEEDASNRNGSDVSESERKEEEEEEEVGEREKKRGRKPRSGKGKSVSPVCEDDWGENSKDSSWSNVSDVEGGTNRDSPDDYSTRPKTVGKSRRESEVWSELYESLQFAEKLKTSRKKKEKSQWKGEKECSTLAEYSAKRIVKRPKRYGESSGSECSPDGLGDSESDAERASNPAAVEAGPKEAMDRNKKRVLLSKLKNVDHKFVDYLLDLIARKEKRIEMYKRRSGLGPGRPGQHLRTCRKKILSDVTLRGRAPKGAQRDDSEKKEASTLENHEDTVKRKEAEVREVKSVERRRGRPRKIIESGKLKERRRSDKEVDFIQKNFEREGSGGGSPSKRKRKLSSKLQYYKKINLADDKEDFSSGQVIGGKFGEVAKKFSCAVCKENFKESSEFREHILSHKAEENTYQCMECGECFVVRPSLEKHLHAFHKIKNIVQYMAENECLYPKREPDESEGETLKENQCKVCKDQFERAIDLTKHFRIHGMAFLKEFRKDGGKMKL